MFEQYDIEEIILGMADIVMENRRLRRELKEAQEYKKKYHDQIDENVRQAAESQKAILEAIFSGAFTNGKEE